MGHTLAGRSPSAEGRLLALRALQWRAPHSACAAPPGVAHWGPSALCGGLLPLRGHAGAVHGALPVSVAVQRARLLSPNSLPQRLVCLEGAACVLFRLAGWVHSIWR